MTTQAWLLMSLVLVGALWLLLHAVVLWQSLSARSLAWKWRLLALIPPAAPGVAWAAGRRVAPLLWGVLMVVYLVLRAL